MPEEKDREFTDLNRDELLKMVSVYLGDVFVHYGMWFTETVHSLGIKKALELENQVLKRYFPLAAQRLAHHFGLEMDGDMPRVLASKSKEELLLLLGDLSKTWVVGDGLWFQAIETSSNMKVAKQVNDTCWSHFAHMEAFKISQFMQLGSHGGLDALKEALKFRIYSSINSHVATWQEDGSLLFQMTECRVQSARRRKGLDDYPCKSAGNIEYSHFATAIDSRIKTKCSYCPPDPVPAEQFCAWQFTLEDA